MKLTRAQLEEGVVCECCGQLAKLYRRTLNSSMVRVLVLLARHAIFNPGEEWAHVETLLKQEPDLPTGLRGDFSKLALWELAETYDGRREDGNPRSGYWRITEKGRSFVRGECSVAEAVLVYNGQIYGWDGPLVDFKTCLGDRFDYNALMRSIAPLFPVAPNGEQMALL